MILHKIYRKLFRVADNWRSQLRILHLRMMYPALFIDRKSYVGRGCRIICEDSSSVKIEASHLAQGSIIVADQGGQINITNTYIGFNSVITAMDAVSIGAGCYIAEMVVIRDQDHVLNEQVKVAEEQYKKAPVRIGNNVWIGAKATVLKGVTIEDNAIIAASAVVNSDVPKSTVAGGIPAKVLKSIRSD